MKKTLTQCNVEQLIQVKKDLARLSITAREIADDSGMTRREIAMLMGNASPSTLQRLLVGAAYNATLDTVARFAWSCDYELQIQFVPRKKQ